MVESTTPSSAAVAQLGAALGAAGPFDATRAWFDLREGLVYLDGNSLGPPPRAALAAVSRLASHEWAQGLVRSWQHAGWWEKPVELGRLLAPLLGAAPDEVVVCDSVSVNLFKVLTAAARLVPDRPLLVVEADAFPTDRYLAESVAAMLGLGVRHLARDEDLEVSLDGAGVALLAHVDYRTSRRLDLAAVTRLAHRQGALVVWDVAHSAGAFPLELDAEDADFAIGCTYKYLNGGPGAPAFIYAARRHLESVSQPISGWHGHEAPFQFRPDFVPDPGARRFLAGTPPLLAFAALEASLRLWQQVDLAEVAAASRSLSELLAGLVDERCPELELCSPADPARRGSHLAYRYADADRLVEALAERDLIADAREPDLVRLSLTPLYLRHIDVEEGVRRIGEVLAALRR